MSQEELETLTVEGLDHEELEQEIALFAATRKISRSLVAYRLHRAGKITFRTWRQIVETYADEFRRQREARRDDGKTGGPNYYIVKRHKVGDALLTLVGRAMASGTLTPARASKVLGVKPRTVLPLLTWGAA